MIVIHFCVSDLLIGPSLCKAMVMTVESVSNDVDEEVYEGEGDETFVARDASDGDGRAVDHADQAGQIVMFGETNAHQAL